MTGFGTLVRDLNPLRVGIAGARGFGRHHARWFHEAGCEVSAIYGTSEESVIQAEAELRNLFPFNGARFTHWDRFVNEGGFEACSVCSPADRHHQNVLSLVRAGKHVLCEKPLTWDECASPETLLTQAREIATVVAESGLVFGMNAQYPAALVGFTVLHQRVTGSAPRFNDLHFLMESKGRPRSEHGPGEVWVDLGPHPLAFLDTLAPGAVDWSTLECGETTGGVDVRFTWRSPDRPIAVRITCRRVANPPVQRLIGTGGFTAAYDGVKVGEQYRCCLRAGDEEWVGPDLMQLSVERFIWAIAENRPELALVTAEAALRQHEALVGVWARCWQKATDR